MKNNYLWVYTSVLIILITLMQGHSLDAQQLFSVASGSESNDKYSIAWSMGEPATITASSPQNHLTQGFHQPAKRLSICVGCMTTSARANVLPSSLKIIQNPTTYFLDFELVSAVEKIQQYEVYDILGNAVVKNNKVSNAELNFRSIAVTHFNVGQYYLRVLTTHGNVLTQTFQVIK